MDGKQNAEPAMIETIYEMELIPVAVNVPAPVAKRRDELIADERCIACEKKLVRDEEGKLENVRRGQCDACYSATRRNIQKRRVTITELVREGRLTNKSAGGRKPRNEYTKHLAQR